MVFPTRLDPISNITGFTYRTGSTYQEILMRLSEYMQTTLPDEFNGSLGKLFNDVNDIATGWETKWGDFMGAVDAELQALNDAAVAGLINTPASAIRQALDAIYDVRDAAVKGLILDANSDTRKALDAIIEQSADFKAGDGYKYAVIAGVLRNNGVEGVFWEILENGHRPVNIDSVETWDDKIRINYQSLGAVMTISLIAVPDETLSRNGFTTGCSVGPTSADIYIHRNTPVIGDYVSYNGTTWVSQNDIFTDISFSGGILYLSHPPVDNESVYNVNITARGGGYVYAVGRGNSPTTPTTLKVDIRDMDGVSAMSPSTDHAMYITRGGGTFQQHPKVVDTIKYPFSNIWIMGIMGLDRND